MNALSILKSRGLLIIIVMMIFYVSLAIYSDLSEFVRNLQKIDGRIIILVLLSFTTSIFIKSIRQFFLLKQINIEIPFVKNVIISFAGNSMLATPGGFGSVIKSHFLLKNFNQSVSKTAPITIFERYHDAIALFSIIILFSIIGKMQILEVPIFIIGMFLLFCILIVKNKKLFILFRKKITKLRFLKNFEEKSSEFNNSLLSLSSKKCIFFAWLISMSAWFFDGLGTFLCFRAFNLDFNFIQATVDGFSSILFGAMSFLPGGVGVTEISLVAILKSQGAPLSVATSLVLFFRLSSIWYTSGIGFIATRFAHRR